MDAESFGTFVAGHRRKKGFTQAQLATMLNVTDKAVSRWERGIGLPDIGTICPLAQALGVSVQDIMNAENKPVFHVVEWYFVKPYKVKVTKPEILPPDMQEHMNKDRELYVVKEEDGKKYVSVSKETEGIPVDDSYIAEELKINIECMPSMQEPFRAHVENGGEMYMTCGRVYMNSKAEGPSYEVDRRPMHEEWKNDITGLVEKMVQCVKNIKNQKKPEEERRSSAFILWQCLVCCTYFPELDMMTDIYRDEKKDNAIGYHPLPVWNFIWLMRLKYIGESYHDNSGHELMVKGNTEGLTEENLVGLWYSVGWYDGLAKMPGRLFGSIQKSDTLFTMWDDSKLIGLCSAMDDSLNAWISYMVVNPEYQKLGIGSWLLNYMKRRYNGFHIYVQTMKAAGFYEKNGFEQVMASMKMDRTQKEPGE